MTDIPSSARRCDCSRFHAEGPACHFVIIAPVWVSPVGLSLDFVGVIFLGIDLVRVQRAMKRQANEDLARFNAMVEDHGGN